jgi:hypothetical protein
MLVVLLGVGAAWAVAGSPGSDVAMAGAGFVFCGVGIWDGDDVPRDAGDENDGQRLAAGGKLEDSVRARVVLWVEPGISDLGCDLVWRHSGFHLVSTVQEMVLTLNLM